MLILSRRANEVLMIGDDVEVHVLRVDRHGNVRLGIVAPRDVAVHRREVYERIQIEHGAARAKGGKR